jgi:hypothetical protein
MENKENSFEEFFNCIYISNIAFETKILEDIVLLI